MMYPQIVKQKFVVSVPSIPDDEKRRTKAMKAVGDIRGVESAVVEGAEVVVIGVGVDALEIIKRLKKVLGEADFVSVDVLDHHCEISDQPSCCKPCTIM